MQPWSLAASHTHNHNHNTVSHVQPRPHTLLLPHAPTCMHPLTVVYAWLTGLVQPFILGDLVVHLLHEAVLCGADGWGTWLHLTSPPGPPPAPGSVPLGVWRDLVGVANPSPLLGTHPQHSGTCPCDRACLVAHLLSLGGRTGCNSHLWAEWWERVRGRGPPVQRTQGVGLGFPTPVPQTWRCQVLNPGSLRLPLLRSLEPSDPRP